MTASAAYSTRATQALLMVALVNITASDTLPSRFAITATESVAIASQQKPWAAMRGRRPALPSRVERRRTTSQATASSATTHTPNI